MDEDKKIFRALLALWGFCFAMGLAVLGVAAYVAYHFIMKVW